MYFLPRNNKFYSFVVHLNPNYRYLLTLAVCGAFSLIWIFAIHMPLKNSIEHTRKEIKQLHNQCMLCNQATGSCASLATSIESMKVEVNRRIENTNNSAQDAVLYIIDQAQHNNLAIHNCIIEHDEEHQWYIEHEISFDVSGTFKNMSNFLRSIINEKHSLAFKHYQLTRLEEERFSLKGVVGVLAAKG